MQSRFRRGLSSEVTTADHAKPSSLRQLKFLQAIYEAQSIELRRDPTVIIMGQDMRANLYGTSGGFLNSFGPERVRDLPLSEAASVGVAVGAALSGIRPIVDMTFASFVYGAMDQFISQAAKVRYMFGGQATVPVVFRASMYYFGGNAAHHSDRPHPMFMNVPGLKIAMPSSARDARGLLSTAVREDDPVIFFEDTTLWGPRGRSMVDFDENDEFLLPFGIGEVKREGSDITIVALGGTVPLSIEAAREVEAEGVSCEVIDPRSLVPMDWDLILSSIAKTGRLVVVDMACRTCSAASEIAATVVEEAFSSLRAPIRRVTTPDIHIPFSTALEVGLSPTVPRICKAIRLTAGLIAAK